MSGSQLQDMSFVITVVDAQKINIGRFKMAPDGMLSNDDLSIHESTQTGTHNSPEELVDPNTYLETMLISQCNVGSNQTATVRKGKTVRCTLSMDPMLASCLVTEIQRSSNFVLKFRLFVMKKLPWSERSGRKVCQHFENPKEVEVCGAVRGDECCTIFLCLKLHKTARYFKIDPDIRWSHRMLPQWMQRLQMEESFSWLSTLGGAYSSLGDNMYNCALEAGRVALRQLYLAERMEDPILKARCLLYIALSLMQRGKLFRAKQLVRQQFKFATSRLQCSDSRLVNMCRGIWHHLRHHYAKRKET
ncbi:uncharacterized protein LOC117306328 [Asterias rubens]|uniref:uncharacterized protein LOC117306328 n=1 Tax=Asterias rubens TaxID=7604 RepID=UPI001455D74A|nr:uncharacterized protein LOC117306328 [Asterias rubens]